MQDTADQYLRDRRLPPVLQAVIGGKFAQQIICRGVPYRSEKEEDFYQVQCKLHGCCSSGCNYLNRLGVASCAIGTLHLLLKHVKYSMLDAA